MRRLRRPALRDTRRPSDPVMLWVLIAAALVLWLVGILLRLGTWVNLFLIAGAVLIVYRALRSSAAPDGE